MKFFSLLIGVFIFCTSYAQDSTVTIPNSVARYFLEQNDRAILLQKQVEIKDYQLSNLGEQLINKDKIISTYKTDSITYNNLILLNQQRIVSLNNELIKSNKEIIKQKRLKRVGFGIAILTAVLAIL